MDEEETILIDNLSVVSVFIEMYFNEIKLAVGTAFFTERNGEKYLITNLHNLSGRNSITKKPLDTKNSAIPNKVRVYHHDLENLGNVIPKNYNLQDEDGKSLFYEHPIHSNKIDVAVLPVTDDTNIYTIEQAIKESDPYEAWTIEVGENLYVLGYPFGITASAYFPIWKAATIASEPNINIDELPKFYIDTATKKGMSGSAVIQKERRAVAIMSEGLVTSRFRVNFLGVYSGRVVEPQNEFDTQIGIVWKKNCIDEIIEEKKLYE
jgi:hypothetical protein